MDTITAHLRRFAHEHDDLPVFHAGYLVLALLSAGLFNLGAFGLIIFAHMVLDYVKYREVHGYDFRGTVEGIMRESLVDVALLFVGLVFAVYLHHSVGIASLSGLMRAEVTILRAVAIAVPKIKILHHFLKIMSHLHHYLQQVHPHMRKEFTGLDYLCIYFIAISVVLIALAAPLMHVDISLIQNILADELLPWRL